MKIAHVVDSMEVGGAETLVLQMCRLQREQGHDPCVYAVAGLGALGERCGRKASPCRRTWAGICRIPRGVSSESSRSRGPTLSIFITRRRRSMRPSAARMAGVPSIVSTRHSLVAPPHRDGCGVEVRRCSALLRLGGRHLRRDGEQLKSDSHCAPARKIVRVYNGAAPLKRAAKEDWPPKSGFTLVYVGRLEPVKNHALAAAMPFAPRLRPCRICGFGWWAMAASARRWSAWPRSWALPGR